MYEIVNKNIPVLEINFQKLIDYWSMEVNNIVITGHASECNVSDDEYSSDNTHFCSKLKYSKFNLQIFLDQGPEIPLLSSAVQWRNRISELVSKESGMTRGVHYIFTRLKRKLSYIWHDFFLRLCRTSDFGLLLKGRKPQDKCRCTRTSHSVHIDVCWP